MTKLKISDLSFFEVAAQKDTEVKGGLSLAKQLAGSDFGSVSVIRNSSLNQFSNISSGNLEPISISTEDTFEKISDEASGISGVNFASKDGTTKVTVLKGPDSSFVSASSIQISS